MDFLLDNVGWVTYVFADGTIRNIHTTFNKKMLYEYGIVLMPDFLFDLDHLQLVRWSDNIVDVQINKEKPVANDEVSKFESRFI